MGIFSTIKGKLPKNQAWVGVVKGKSVYKDSSLGVSSARYFVDITVDLAVTADGTIGRSKLKRIEVNGDFYKRVKPGEKVIKSAGVKLPDIQIS